MKHIFGENKRREKWVGPRGGRGARGVPDPALPRRSRDVDFRKKGDPDVGFRNRSNGSYSAGLPGEGFLILLEIMPRPPILVCIYIKKKDALNIKCSPSKRKSCTHA